MSRKQILAVKHKLFFFGNGQNSTDYRTEFPNGQDIFLNPDGPTLLISIYIFLGWWQLSLKVRWETFTILPLPQRKIQEKGTNIYEPHFTSFYNSQSLPILTFLTIYLWKQLTVPGIKWYHQIYHGKNSQTLHLACNTDPCSIILKFLWIYISQVKYGQTFKTLTLKKEMEQLIANGG